MDHCIDINEMAPWVKRLTTRLEDECNNFTIPTPLPNVVPEKKASTFKNSNNKDRAIVLGPYKRHMSTEGLLYTETERRGAFMLTAKVFKLDFKKFIYEISAKINDVQACYAEHSFEMDDEELAEMLLLDSFFIISVITVLSQGPYPDIWKKKIEGLAEEPTKNACKSYIVKSNEEARELMGNLLMLENQIPFFVIHCLWVNCYNAMISDEILSFKKVALSCFDDYYPGGIKFESADTSDQFSDCLHLLDLFHWSRMPLDRFKDRATTQPNLYISTATELQAFSVIFEKRKSECSLDITFCQRNFRTRGVISIPEIHLYPYSRCIIQNLVAFEQANRLRGYGFTMYVECLAQLIQTKKDVSILRSSGIIASTPMTDREVIDFYRTIHAGVQVEEMPPDLYNLYEQVKNHKENRCRIPDNRITILVVSVLPIFVLSLFQWSFLQTFFPILGCYHPHK